MFSSLALPRLPARFLQTWSFVIAPWSMRRQDLVSRLDEVLVGSLLLIAVSLSCIGAAMCDQAASQALRLLGDQSFIGPEYIILGFEEYGPIAVAVTFASRVGAGFAAEVATLTSEQTLDALDHYGAEPSRHLLAPMGVACILGCACLGLLSVVVWETAGILTMWTRHGVNPLTFFRPDAVALHSVVLCLVKNLSFGVIVFSAALFAGLRARGGAEEVGIATTRAVVWGVVCSLAANLLVDIVWFSVRGPA
jgi:phospholipid/cholesterol/gamma-HCH transport system permease protein